MYMGGKFGIIVLILYKILVILNYLMSTDYVIVEAVGAKCIFN